MLAYSQWHPNAVIFLVVFHVTNVFHRGNVRICLVRAVGTCRFWFSISFSMLLIHISIELHVASALAPWDLHSHELTEEK
ncbi:hypothetical protein DM01DRAFT_1073468 [Hesseltinella vesiculosa]|uniref:Uncharacterized protein n=1 Tax=Hesseltinella vesiculosa TaxID=101127 RepID=A0A1X2GVU1_9FUNG|nr:hypothetical protein DM01DRAFT_1073468 [Hesseltinella vesiculosa]